MYGQTEATSRIARLDPADLPGRLGSVGTAVPGGTITIGPAPAHARTVPGEGAVHYRGPGVMLGYATARVDLCRGAEVDVLDTGDLGYLREGYLSALESNARHLTADELADARALSAQLVETYPGDLPKIAAALTDRYDRLIRAVADRLSVHEFLRQELTGAFTAYLDYLLLASEGGFDMRMTTPLFLCSAGYEPPVEGARTIVLDIGHDDLLRAPRVHELVTDLLTGEHPW